MYVHISPTQYLCETPGEELEKATHEQITNVRFKIMLCKVVPDAVIKEYGPGAKVYSIS